MFNNAAAWLRRCPDIRTSEINAIQTESGLAFPDALIDDPSLCVTLVKRLTLVSVERDAPAGVVTDLVRLLERMRTGPAAMGLLDYTFYALKALRGMRDRYEIEPILVHALEAAPDAINKAKLERLLDLVRQPEPPAPKRTPSPPVSPIAAWRPPCSISPNGTRSFAELFM